MITRMTGKYQVTVPAEVVAKANLAPGTRLQWRVTKRPDILEVRILPDQAAIARSLRGAGRASLRKKGSPVARLVAERVSEDAGRGGT
jgi:bifunctional DNA-binding transcriptional regulator/antitoxin component of YhaV-PrlF toxin-antitoxin module